MKLIKNKEFCSLIVDIYEDNNEFYMSRKQLNEALGYKDIKSLAKVISRNKEVIGIGTTFKVLNKEGDKIVPRNIELFTFNQIFNILRFSKQPRANDFMTFTAETLKQLITEKAVLTFKEKEDELLYAAKVKEIISRCNAYGLDKTQVNMIIQTAKMENIDPEILIFEELKKRRELQLAHKRGRIRERVNYIAITFKIPHETVWHELSNRLKYEMGYNFLNIRAKAKAKEMTPPSYLDLIADHNVYDEAEKMLERYVESLQQVKIS